MIVEDDPAIFKLIDTNLTLSGYQTVCAMDGKQAVEAIQAWRFDLALCDIMLPELDGFEMLPYMKEKGIHTGIIPYLGTLFYLVLLCAVLP